MQDETPHCAPTRKPLSIAEWVGITLMVLSFVLFWSILALPFVGDLGVHKGMVVAALLIGGEVAFWLGVLIAGRDFMRRYRDQFSIRRLVAWFNERDTEQPASGSTPEPTDEPTDEPTRATGQGADNDASRGEPK